MKTMECPSCAMEIDAKSEKCPICAYEFPRQSRWTQWVAVLLVLLFLYLMIF
jgi:RNA polymerase subunit RPABC4/transcription elongation factor Spt4